MLANAEKPNYVLFISTSMKREVDSARDPENERLQQCMRPQVKYYSILSFSPRWSPIKNFCFFHVGMSNHAENTNFIFIFFSFCQKEDKGINRETPTVSKSIWFATFIGWLVRLNRLTTKDRLIPWRSLPPYLCGYCLLAQQLGNHLFFLWFSHRIDLGGGLATS